MPRKVLYLLGVLLVTVAPVRAEVKPHALCTDGMVLQQQSKVKIWGTADPREKVAVMFRDQTASTVAGADGAWMVSLNSGPAGGPLPMTIKGENTLQYQEVYVGEVWVCSGQSNMQWAISQCDESDKKAAMETPPNPQLRLFYVPRVPAAKPLDDVPPVQNPKAHERQWVAAEPKTALPFSATAYFFGRDLQKALKVPVGLIHTSWGGTRAEAWTSRDVLDRHATYKNEAKAGDKLNPNVASVLYNGMIHPLLNYTIKGAIWYQGESNAGKAYAYRELFPMMIQNWRKDWQQGDFPFYFVQLAPWLSAAKEPGDSSWAELREAQLMTLKLPKTGMAVITDLGHEMDIHPTPKRPVGERLSLVARAKTYGEDIVYSGPIFKSMKIDGNKAILTFEHVGGGLVAHEMEPTDTRKNPKTGQTGSAWRVKDGSKNAELRGFAIAGSDKKFHNAEAKIVDNTVVVHSDSVSQPVAVRYGWADHPIVNLFNREGLPASPFRTDTYTGVTQGK